MAAMAQNEKEKGNAAFKAGDFPTAIGHYTAAFLADPSNPTYPMNRAAAYLRLGKNEDAERDCDAVVRLDKKSVKGYFRRGQARLALQKLHEAESDFQEALKLEPSNNSVKQELSKVRDALKTVPVTSKNRKPVNISTPASTVEMTPPKRRRIPITIVEPDADASSALPKTTSTLASDSGLLTAVSSRPLSKSPSPPSAVSQPPILSFSAATTIADVPTGPKPPPQTFREAKAAREEHKPRGGIFRSDGRSSLFYTSSPPAKVPKRETPVTFVAFTRIWNELTTEEERWDVLRQIPATRLPVLFKTSLSASLLAAILHCLRVALEASQDDPQRIPIVRAYMINLPRVPRFTTVSLMMSGDERADAQVVWDLLGRSRGGGVEGEMDKRKEDGSRSAWGCH